MKFRVYASPEGKQIDAISNDGVVYPLELKSEDKDLEYGYYDESMRLTEKETPPKALRLVSEKVDAQ